MTAEKQRACGPPSENRVPRMATSSPMLVASVSTWTPGGEGLQPADVRPTFSGVTW